MTALFGAHQNNRQEEGTEAIQVEKIVTHPKYRLRAFNDIAIMKLSRPVKFSPSIQPVCLPAAGEQVPDGVLAIVAGWGTSSGEITEDSNLYDIHDIKSSCTPSVQKTEPVPACSIRLVCQSSIPKRAWSSSRKTNGQ